MTGRTWRTETDLERVKDLSLILLDADIKRTKHSPLVVSHAFTDSGIVGIVGENGKMKIADLLDDPAAVKEWREQVGQRIKEAETALLLFVLLTKPYRMGFLKYAAPYLSEQDAAQLLTWAWISCEAPNSDPNFRRKELLDLFRSIDPAKLMDAKEYERFQGLDDVVTVYRGVTSYNAQNVKVLSWTLDPSTATWFAHRYGEQGMVYQAQIRKEHICALFLGRNESEVIVDPKHLMGLSTLEMTMATEEKQDLSMVMGGM